MGRIDLISEEGCIKYPLSKESALNFAISYCVISFYTTHFDVLFGN